MSVDDFWKLIEQANEAADGEPEQKEVFLRKKLAETSPDNVQAFGQHMDHFSNEAYRWDLWAAAYIINGGCCDDSFSDFRSSLVSMGRQTYQAAIASPDSLADLTLSATKDETFHEGFQYIGFTLYEEMTGEQMPDTEVDFRAEPEGDQWDEDDENSLKALCPRLFAKYWDTA